MKTYRSHKLVTAAKIVGAFPRSRTVVLALDDGQGFPADLPWIEKHAELGDSNSLVGGYLVTYADGYTSWSPAAAFEAGYVEVETKPADPDKDSEAAQAAAGAAEDRAIHAAIDAAAAALEPEACGLDITKAFLLTDRAAISQAISLRRIADAMCGDPEKVGVKELLIELVAAVADR